MSLLVGLEILLSPRDRNHLTVLRKKKTPASYNWSIMQVIKRASLSSTMSYLLLFDTQMIISEVIIFKRTYKSSSNVCAMVWINHLKSRETLVEKHQKTRILEASPHTKVCLRNNLRPNWLVRNWWRIMDKIINDVLWNPLLRHTRINRSTLTCIHQVCVGIRWSLEDRLRTILRERERERESQLYPNYKQDDDDDDTWKEGFQSQFVLTKLTSYLVIHRLILSKVLD